MPSAVRDQFGIRWAFRSTTPDQSDVILSKGWAERGFDASQIRPEDRGVSYLLAEGGTPVRMRTFHLSTDDVRALAASSAPRPDPDPGGTYPPDGGGSSRGW
ncbi:MAG: hypothetical protein ACXVS6_19230 [Solirubrobacteraceae bacterium]